MSRVVCISQPRYLPAPGYLHRFHLADVFVLLDTVQYTPRDWENRNRIKGPGGPQWLSVPVVRERRDQPISTIRIDDGHGWAGKHREALRTNYSKSPWFAQRFPFFDDVYSREWALLADLNEYVTGHLVSELGFRCETVRASALGASGTGQALLIDIVRAVGGEVYLSGPLGRNYIDDATFREAGIELVYHDYEPIAYDQRFGPFQPGLSAVDILFNCSPADSHAIVRAGGAATEKQLGRDGDG